MAHHVEDGFVVDPGDHVELLFAHLNEKAVLGDAGVVDQYVDGAEAVLHRFCHGFAGGKVGDVAEEALCFHTQRPAGFSDLIAAVFPFPFAQAVDGDVEAVGGQRFCHAGAQTLRSAGDQCGFCHNKTTFRDRLI